MTTKKHTQTAKKNSSKKARGEDVVTIPLWKRLDSTTVRGISGVLLFVLAILLLLSAFGMAGAFGTFFEHALFGFLGIGFYLIPLMLGSWAWSLLSTRALDQNVRPIRMIGAGLLFLSLLALLGTVTENRAGVLGELIAQPLIASLDTLASIVVLTGVLIVSLLLLFDSSLWVQLLETIRNAFAKMRQPKERVVAEDAVSTEDLEEDPLPPAPRTDADVDVDVDDEEEDMDEEYDDEEENDVVPAKTPVVQDPPKAPTPRLTPPQKYNAPPVSLLESDKGKPNVGDTKSRANAIQKTLLNFKIPVEMDRVTVGPSVTRYTLKPAAGIRLNKIVGLQSNLELNLAASPIRIEAPIPGKSLVGIEVPNTAKALVGLAGLLDHPDFATTHTPLLVSLGKEISGAPIYTNIAKTPHLLIAGTTGSGKSVMIHSIITSLLYRNGPAQLKFIMIDPKRVELTLYDGIPHLLTPVITDPKRCIFALKWAAKEMDTRYNILREYGEQGIEGYHTNILAPEYARMERLREKGTETPAKELPPPMPYIVIVIDELADIMATYPKELESAIVRLAQMSRAVGIHLILSTQRPSVNVITGIIKANIPSRIALKVLSNIDSRTILDRAGAEKLLGYGDMLYLSQDSSDPKRIQSPYLTNVEVKRIVSYIKKNNEPEMDAVMDLAGSDNAIAVGGNSAGGIDLDSVEADDELDEIYEDVRAFLMVEKRASTSLIQRRFKVGYGRAARIMDQLEKRGVIEPSDGTNKPRKVLEYEEE
jgi:S-DNA-T family DNA segregation ATPase FtsK/SpoIIIE